VCGSLNQTSQLHAIARELPDWDARFSPYYGDGTVKLVCELGLAEFSIGGHRLRRKSVEYLRDHQLELDIDGRAGGYDLHVTCSDVVIPKNLKRRPIVAVQEGILDPDGVMSRLVMKLPRLLPLWFAGTAGTGLSGAYERFCVASEGYRDLFASRGAPRERLVVTGIPNFDDCAKYRDNDFPHRDYVLVCSSDARETLKRDDRKRFVDWALGIAEGRRVLFKLHPNEDAERARRELRLWAPRVEVYAQGPTNAMIANASVLITQYSTVAFVGLALGKEVHSYHPVEELRRLTPEQNGCAAKKIAEVCREVLAGSTENTARDARGHAA
jgi:hypothetical protein